MTKNRMDDLRDHLFAELEELRDRDTEADLGRAKAILGVADRLIATGKLEVDFLRVTGEEPGSPFFDRRPLLGQSTAGRPHRLTEGRRRRARVGSAGTGGEGGSSQ